MWQDRLLRRMRCLHDGDKLVRVKSWWPSPDPHGIAWPCMLVDNRAHHRSTTWPIWFWRDRKYRFLDWWCGVDFRKWHR